jgi:protein prenyltransferase alpha subunit repeat containing protein 1
MSRALEKQITNSLRAGNHQRSFDEIASIFSSPTQPEQPCLLEIEFLAHGHPLGPGECFLREGNAVAIPKLQLIQAFFVARQHLASESQLERQGNDIGSSGEGPSLHSIRKSTAVLLLTDPEHVTAANWRKRVIVQAITAGHPVEPLLTAEGHFVDSLLTSPLHRHSKSPTLWNHRRWLLEQHRKHAVGVNVPLDLAGVVLPSGERHPRNYYAWSHARWLMGTFVEQDATKDRQSITNKIISDVKTWCQKHHTDISGWSFLLNLLQRKHTPPSVCESVFRETTLLAESLQWRNDSVWWFLHAMVSTWLVASECVAVFESVAGRLFLSEGAWQPRDDELLASKWHHSGPARRGSCCHQDSAHPNRYR